MIPYIIFIFSLILARAAFLVIKNYMPVSVKELPSLQHKLRELSEELRTIDAKSHYMALWRQLSSLSDPEYLFSKINSPLKNHRILVDDKGIISINEQKERINYTDAEKLTIAIAIYQLVYVISINSLDRDSEFLIRKGIIPLLMRPFSHLYGTFEVKQVEAELRQLLFSNYRKVNTPKKYHTQEEIEANSAQIIQRAFRQHRFKMELQKGNIQPEKVCDSLRESMVQHHISENPKEPHPIVFTPEQKLEWIKGAKPAFKSVVKTLVPYLVTYRSHAKFMGRLQEVVSKFNAYQHSLPEESREYVLIVPRAHEIKSNHWVNALALPFFIKKPLAILYPNEVKAFKEENPSLQQLVFLDDAFYSGRQLTELTDSTFSQELNIVVLLPFYMSSGLYRLNKECFLIVGERMITPKDLERYSSEESGCWTSDSSELIDKVLPRNWSSASTKVGYFFNHKVADNASTFISKGLGCLHSQGDRLIPHIRTPY